MQVPPIKESSVLMSLAELARIERERTRDEEVAREHERQETVRAEAERAAEERRVEEGRAADERDRRDRREAAATEARVRSEARERAAVEVARITAAAEAQLEADNAAREHEIAVLRARSEGTRGRLVVALGVVLALVVTGAAIATYEMDGHTRALAREADTLRVERSALLAARARRAAATLATLDRRFSDLRGRPISRDAEVALNAAVAARRAVDEATIDDARLDAFAGAVDRLEERIEKLEWFALLGARETDLTSWAAQRRRGESLSMRRVSEAKMGAIGGDERGLRAYGAALDELRSDLAGADPAPHKRASSTRSTEEPACQAWDPICGLNGARF